MVWVAWPKSHGWLPSTLRALAIPGRDIEVALKAVRAGVQQTTQGQQILWVVSSMTGDFYITR